MPCHTRMKLLLRGLLWMFILEFGFMVTSLEPGFLDFDNLPDTNFSCVGKVIGGYYADLETSCQMFHVCTIGQLDEPMDIRFLCLNGTVFDQETRVCERIDEVDCAKSEQFYSLNLELYGNTQPPILEESSETEMPDVPIPKKTTTTTTTTARPTVAKTPRQNFIITTSKSMSSTTTSASSTVRTQIPQTPKPPQPQPQLHFGSRPQENTATDIRFNPEEYKISLSSGGPPSIRPSTSNSANAKPISFQTFSDNNKRVIVTTHSTVYKSEKQPLHVVTNAPVQPPSTEKTVTHDDYDADAELSDSTEDGYSYGYHSQQHQPETLKLSAYHGQSHGHAEGHGPIQSQTEAVPKTYQYRPGFRPSQVLAEYKPSTFRSIFHPATNNPLKLGYNPREMGPTTYRTLPNQNHYGYFNQGPLKQIEKQRIPIIPPLTFSSPAPFSLNRHVETKRFIDHRAQQNQQSQQASQQHLHHHQPPRIVISASASVSDASGRKFNYSLGTIGDTRFFGHAPQSYDDYKEDDVGLDPFYHDVPKLRLKRQAPEAPDQIDSQQNGEQGEKEAIDVLRFLFNWYSNHEKNHPSKSDIPIKSETITEINDALTPRYKDPEEHIAHDNIYQKDYLYEDLDVDKQPNYAGVQRPEFQKPFLSLQLLKPPFESSLKTTPPTTTTTTIQITIEPIDITEELTTTSTTTTPSSKLNEGQILESRPDGNYYDYVDDNYEPSIYQEELKQQEVKEARTHQAHALADYQQFKESFVQNYPEKGSTPLNSENKKEQYSEQNYTLPEYVDDNYEPVVYQQNPKEFHTEGYDKINPQYVKVEEIVPTVETTLDTLTTLNLPSFGVNNVQQSLNVDNYQIPNKSELKASEGLEHNYYYDKYNKELVTTTSVQNVLTTLTTQPSITHKPIRNYDVYQNYGNFKVRNQYQYDVEEKSKQGRVTEAPTTVTTDNYHQVLGILGITTRKPEEPRRKEKVRNHGRGRTRFALKDVADIPDDVVFIRRQPTSTTSTTATTTESAPSPAHTTPTIETTTQELEYTINVNRRTELDIRDVDDLVFTTENMTTLITTLPTYKTTKNLLETTEYQHLVDVKDYVKVEEVSDVVKPLEVESTSTQATPRLFESQTETNESYTTIHLQKLIEKIEGTTKSIAENKTVDNQESEVTTTLKMTTATVPTTDDIKIIASTTTEMSTEIIREEKESNKTSFEVSTFDTTNSLTSQMPTTTTTSTTPTTTTPAPYYISPRSPKSRTNLENSRRRSKSRFRQSQYVASSFPSTTSTTPATSTTMSTMNTTETPGTIIEVKLDTTTEIPSSIAFASTTLPTVPTTPTLTHRTPSLNEEIIDVIKNKMASAHDPRKIEFNINAFTANLAYRVKTTPLTIIGSNLGQKEANKDVDVVPSTDPPIVKSVQPTLSQEHLTRANRLPTTPISQSTAINVRKQVKHRKYVFSCVDKEVNQFYYDPRDCRLFHYCTRGFTRTQYLDMKFVCDLGTFFDDVRLVCTKEKPARCA